MLHSTKYMGRSQVADLHDEFTCPR